MISKEISTEGNTEVIEVCGGNAAYESYDDYKYVVKFRVLGIVVYKKTIANNNKVNTPSSKEKSLGFK